jgi:hypothetical protein
MPGSTEGADSWVMAVKSGTFAEPGAKEPVVR